jgi:hypothetical protein
MTILLFVLFQQLVLIPALFVLFSTVWLILIHMVDDGTKQGIVYQLILTWAMSAVFVQLIQALTGG